MLVLDSCAGINLSFSQSRMSHVLHGALFKSNVKKEIFK